MEILFIEVTSKQSAKRFCFKVDRLQSFAEKEGYTKIYLDTTSFEILETYQEFIDKIKTSKN
jgi:hypothetical protein